MIMINDVIIYTTLIKQQKCYFTKMKETLTFRNSMDIGSLVTLLYISKQAEAFRVQEPFILYWWTSRWPRQGSQCHPPCSYLWEVHWSLVSSLPSGRATAGVWQRIASPSLWFCVQSPCVPLVLGVGPSVTLYSHSSVSLRLIQQNMGRNKLG